MFKKAKKRAITLVEMMIVMFLIAMITGVIAYNYSGSLDEGKYFKTKTGMEKLHTILSMHRAAHPGDTITWQQMVNESPLVKDKKALLTDGWGKEYNVDFTDDDVIITSTSPKYLSLKAAKNDAS